MATEGRNEAAVTIVFPGDPATRTGGFIYDRTICDRLAGRGWQVDRLVLPEGWPAATPEMTAAAEAALAGLPDGRLTVVDGLAAGVLDAELARHAGRLRLVCLVHHPLAEETGLRPAERERLAASERAALAQMRRVLTTSQVTADSLAAHYGVEPERLAVVAPGVEAAALAEGSDDGTVHLLCVATLTPRKGHVVLLEALAGLTDRPWRLSLAGSADRAPDYAEALHAQAEALGLTERVAFLGEVGEAELATLYHAADLLVLPSFHEGFGMVVVEAVARGVPVLASGAGALVEALPPGAGRLVAPGDILAWRTNLAALLDDPRRLAELADGARRARPDLWTWDQAADAFAAELAKVAG